MSGCICELVDSCRSWGRCVDLCEDRDESWCCCAPKATPTPTPTPIPTPMPCSPLVRTGNDVLDRVLFCVGGVGVTVAVLIVAFIVLLLLLRLRRRRR
jgi:hypothetical protein